MRIVLDAVIRDEKKLHLGIVFHDLGLGAKGGIAYLNLLGPRGGALHLSKRGTSSRTPAIPNSEPGGFDSVSSS